MLTRHLSHAMDCPSNSQYYAYKYFRPRWQKTQITFFASCVKSDGVTHQVEQKENTILTAQMITLNENLTSGSFSNASESSDISEMASFSSSFDETDDVFATTQHRGSSEPLKSALMGRYSRRKSNKLRSKSEEIKEKFHERRKITKSASSPANSTSNSSQRGSSSHSQLNFLPQVVKKISLRTSLQDWLESEKQSLSRESRHSRTSDSSVGMKKQLKYTGRSKSLNSEPIVWEGRDYNKCFAVAKHEYRRFSADSADNIYHSESSGCRSPAPLSLSCNKDDGERHGNCKNTISEEEITTSHNIRRSAMVACCNTDVRYDNDHDFHIQCVMKEELRSRLGSLTFCAESCRDWCEEISEVIKEKVQLLNTSLCKVICTIYIGALRDCGIHTATQALLDYKLDNHAAACYQNNSIFAMASVFVVRYNCK